MRISNCVMQKRGVIVKKVCLILLLLVPLLSGCDKRPIVALCVRQDSSDSWQANCLRTHLEQSGYLVAMENAGNDQSRQNRQVEQHLERGCDLLILEPVMAAATEQLLRQAKDAEVPVILLSGSSAENGPDDYENVYCIGTDLKRVGKTQSELIRTLPNGGDINNDGTIMYTVISGPKNYTDTRYRTLGCVAAIDGVCLEVGYGGWEKEDGVRICQQQISRGGDQLDVILCDGEEITLGALEALVASEKTVGENVYLLGLGVDNRVLDEIRNGRLTGLVAPDVQGFTASVVNTADAILAGQPQEKMQYNNYVAVTKENVDAYEKAKAVW